MIFLDVLNTPNSLFVYELSVAVELLSSSIYLKEKLFYCIMAELWPCSLHYPLSADTTTQHFHFCTQMWFIIQAQQVD